MAGMAGMAGLHGDDSDGQEKKGAGAILFDTFMSLTYPPDSAVVFPRGSGGSRRWFGFKKHKFGVSFDFSEAIPHAKAVAENCADYYDGCKLSGDGKTYGSDKEW